MRRVAFGLAAGVYDRLVDHAPWRQDCRDLGALLGGHILDLGVGPGVSAVEMAQTARGARVAGIDLSASMLRRARRNAAAARLTLALVRADAAALPFGAATFDAAAGHSFLYLVRDAAAVLAEVRRVVRPGGRVAFLEPRAGPARLAPAFASGLRAGTAMALWRVMSRLHRRYSEADLAALLASAGFGEARAWPVLDGLGVVTTAVRP